MVLCVAAFVPLALTVDHLHRATSFDAWVLRTLYFHLGPDAAQVTLDATNEYLLIAAVCFAALGCATWRRFDAAALVVLTPGVALALTEFVLKPLVGRRFGDGSAGAAVDELSPYAFPSGHTAALTGLTASLALVVLRAPLGRAIRTLTVTLLAVWTVIGAVGLVRNNFHYATDTIGGFLVSVTCALGLALAIDTVARVSSPGARTPARTTPAA